MKVIACQISNQLINPSPKYEGFEGQDRKSYTDNQDRESYIVDESLEKESKSEEYFDLLYSEVPGYYKGEDFWEIPLWIAELSNSIPDLELHIVRNMKESIEYLRQAETDYVCFSCLEVNKEFIKEIIDSLKEQKFILGGYISEEYFYYAGLHAWWFYTLRNAIEFMGFTYQKGVSYRLFQGMKTIPRLTLSKGCTNYCSFCTVPKKIEELSTNEIFPQCVAMKDLDFELVYLNDKTFGQAKNHTELICLYHFLKSLNPNFQGFIIQTTASQFLKFSSKFLQDSHIKFVELGVESYNQWILSKLCKPTSTMQIDKACNWIYELNFKGIDIQLIPNVMVGLAGEEWKETRETYQNTLDFLKDNKDIVSHINVYWLSLYEGTKSAKELADGNPLDQDENSSEKTWLRGEPVHEWFYKKVLEFGINQILEGGKI
jgi:tRNA A37 methylthiotransferase MiaB